MINQQHTPDPLRFAWQNNNELQMSFACVVIGDNIVVIGHGAEAEANARRIAAYVNACAEIPTEALEDGGIDKSALGCTVKIANDAIKQRDELLAAAELLLSRRRPGEKEGDPRLILEIDCMNLEDAIASVKGTPPKMNPFATKLYPWQVAIMRRSFVAWVTIPLIVSETYWRTWYEVYRG